MRDHLASEPPVERDPRGRLLPWLAFVILGSGSSWFITYIPIPGLGPEQQFQVCGIGLLIIAVVTSWSGRWPVVFLLPPAWFLAFLLTVRSETGEGSGMLFAVGFMFGFTISYGTLCIVVLTRMARRWCDEDHSTKARTS